MVTADASWTISKCHRVIRLLETPLSRYANLLNKYPYLVQFPYEESDSGRPNPQLRPRRIYSSKLPKTVGGTSSHYPKYGIDAARVFEYYRDNGSPDAYSCLKSIFNAFQLFMEMSYQQPLTSLAHKAAFSVGNCIAIAEDDIDPDTWYCYTDTLYGYQRIVCLGHGVGLVLKNAHVLRHVLPAFIHECVLQGWTGIGELIAHELVSVLNKKEFWKNVDVVNCCLEPFSSQTKALAIQYIPTHLKVSDNVNLKSLVKYFDAVSLDNTSVVQFEDSLEYTLQILLRKISVMLKGNSKKVDSYRAAIVDIIRCRFTSGKNVPPTPTFVSHLLSRYIPNSHHYSEIRFILNVYVAWKDNVSLVDSKGVLSELGIDKHLAANLFCTFFPDFDDFKRLVDFVLPEFPEAAREASIYYVQHSTRDLSAIQWQDLIETKADVLILKMKTRNVQQWPKSWIHSETVSEVTDISSEREEEEEVITRPSSRRLIPPATPISCDKKVIDGKYSKMLSQHMNSVKTQASLPILQGGWTETPTRERNTARIALNISRYGQGSAKPFKLDTNITYQHDLADSNPEFESEESEVEQEEEGKLQDFLKDVEKPFEISHKKNKKNKLDQRPLADPTFIPNNSTSQYSESAKRLPKRKKDNEAFCFYYNKAQPAYEYYGEIQTRLPGSRKLRPRTSVALCHSATSESDLDSEISSDSEESSSEGYSRPKLFKYIPKRKRDDTASSERHLQKRLRSHDSFSSPGDGNRKARNLRRRDVFGAHGFFESESESESDDLITLQTRILQNQRKTEPTRMPRSQPKHPTPRNLYSASRNQAESDRKIYR